MFDSKAVADHRSSCTIAEVPRFHRPPIQTDCLDELYVSRDEIDSLVAPFHVITLNIKYNTLDRLLAC